MTLQEMLDDLTGAPSCPVDNCDGKVRPHGFFEHFSAMFGDAEIDEANRPWIADAPGSQTGTIVCDNHDYDGEYLG